MTTNKNNKSIEPEEAFPYKPPNEKINIKLISLKFV